MANASANNPSQRDQDEAILMAEEMLILQAQMRIQELLSVKRVSQKELASRLGVSEGQVSQMMSDTPRNFTLRTIARIMHVLDATPEIGFQKRSGRKGTVETLQREQYADDGQADNAWGEPKFGVLYSVVNEGDSKMEALRIHDQPLPEFAKAG